MSSSGKSNDSDRGTFVFLHVIYPWKTQLNLRNSCMFCIFMNRKQSLYLFNIFENQSAEHWRKVNTWLKSTNSRTLIISEFHQYDSVLMSSVKEEGETESWFSGTVAWLLRKMTIWKLQRRRSRSRHDFPFFSIL